MSEKITVNPITLNDKDTGKVYTLEFSAESVRFAESKGFNITQLLDFPVTNIPSLFYFAFRKNHKNVSKRDTDRMLEDMGGLHPDAVVRLIDLYNLPAKSLMNEDEEPAKNCHLTMEL